MHYKKGEGDGVDYVVVRRDYRSQRVPPMDLGYRRKRRRVYVVYRRELYLPDRRRGYWGWSPLDRPRLCARPGHPLVDRGPTLD